MSDENTTQVTPADVAEQAAAKEQQTTQSAESEQTNETSVDDVEELRKQLARLEADNRKLKDENGDRRVKAKEAQAAADERLKKVLQALGVEPADTDPEEQIKQARQVAQEREQERDTLQAELNQLRENDALRQLAKANGADPDLLVPYLRGAGSLPAWGSDEWDSKATELVTNTLKTFPQMCAGNTPRTSGNTTTPTRNDDHRITAEELNGMTAEEIFEANKQGKLKHLY